MHLSHFFNTLTSQSLKATKKYIGKRILATFIDYTSIYILTFLFIDAFGEESNTGEKSVKGLLALVPVIYWFLYFIVIETLYSGSYGHQLVGLRVVSVDNSELTIGRILKRRLSDIIEISWCFGFIAFVIVKGNHNGQRLGDTLAKTIVIDKNDLTKDPDFDFTQLNP